MKRFLWLFLMASVSLWGSDRGLGKRLLPLYELLTEFNVGKAVFSLAFSPDGKLLASGSDDDTVCLWDVDTQKQVGVLTGHSDSVNSVAFSPDGNLFASGSSDGKVRLWEKTIRTAPSLINLTVKKIAQRLENVKNNPADKKLLTAHISICHQLCGS